MEPGSIISISVLGFCHCHPAGLLSQCSFTSSVIAPLSHHSLPHLWVPGYILPLSAWVLMSMSIWACCCVIQTCSGEYELSLKEWGQVQSGVFSFPFAGPHKLIQFAEQVMWTCWVYWSVMCLGLMMPQRLGSKRHLRDLWSVCQSYFQQPQCRDFGELFVHVCTEMNGTRSSSPSIITDGFANIIVFSFLFCYFRVT